MAAADWLDNQKTLKKRSRNHFLNISFLAIFGSRNLSFVHAMFRCHGIWELVLLEHKLDNLTSAILFYVLLCSRVRLSSSFILHQVK